MEKNLIQRLFQGRLKVPYRVRETLQIPRALPHQPRKRWRRPPKYIKGVSNGNYFRIKIPPKRQPLPNVPKLPPTNPMPKPLKEMPPIPQTSKQIAAQQAKSSAPYESYRQRLLMWLRGNLPIIILNVGSICTLVGFTRSDVLELRSLSITGNVMFVIYNLYQKTILWPSVAWSCLFASVNSFKIFEILHERNAEVHMTEEQERIFVEHFMPHGITPKQYERIERQAKRFQLKKGKHLFRKGDQLDHLYLIVEGSTHAHVLGRHLTAASTNPGTRGHQSAGGDSGAWVGEMAFLDSFWEKEQGKQKDRRKGDNPGVDKENSLDDKKSLLVNKIGSRKAIYTVLADEDCIVMAWSHDDMEAVMNSSTDLRAALTRAMTTALVGKVVNLTVSNTRKGLLPYWARWLSDWKYNDGARVQVRNIQELPEDRPANHERIPGVNAA